MYIIQSGEFTSYVVTLSFPLCTLYTTVTEEKGLISTSCIIYKMLKPQLADLKITSCTMYKMLKAPTECERSNQNTGSKLYNIQLDKAPRTDHLKIKVCTMYTN